MSKFTNPLSSVKIASPCSQDWNEMIGTERTRYCGECRLNVYNLSGMSRREAENLLTNSEGRLCVRFYRRTDGSVLTKDCPVGWQAVKKRVSRTAKAFVSICAGIFGGIFAFNQFQSKQNAQDENSIKVSAIDSNIQPNKVTDFETVSIPSIPKDKPASNRIVENYESVVGQMVERIPFGKINKKEINSKKIRRR